MNEDKLKELETKFPYHKEVIELITTYRQLEKDNKALDEKHDDCIDSLCDAADEYFKMKEANAELLAALKQYNETIENYVTMENQIPFDDPAYKDDVEIINKVRQITQHKGE